MELSDLEPRFDEYRLIDVRDPEEWDAGHVPGSLHIPLEQVPDEAAALDSEKRYLVVCRTGRRSARAAETLNAAGLRAESLEGGLTAWVERGLELTASSGGPGRVAGAAAPDPLPPDLAATRDTVMEVIFGLQARYGNREPTDDEAREFMQEWLTDKGKSPDEIARILSD